MTRVAVDPELLHWALERTGLSPDALKKRFKKIDAWLAGEVQPTLKQLEAFANATHTPIGYLFLPDPPEETVPIPDFRIMAHAHIDRPSPDLLDTIYLCQQRQEWYRNHLVLHHEEPLAFVGAASLEDDVTARTAEISQVISFDLAERGQLPSWSEALRRFIAQVEASGVLVMVSGIVGSNTHRRLNPEEFRGFALADDLAPLIFINGADTKAAQMFTLAHELAHIWLGQSGVSDPQAAVVADEKTERWCNAVAAELLAPLEAVRNAYRPEAGLAAEMQRLAKVFKVSTLVILRRLFDLGAIDKQTLWDSYQEELSRLRKLDKGGAGGGDFYRTLGARVSKRFARALVANTLEGQTLFQEAFQMLGIKKTATFYEEASRLGLR